MKKMLGMSTLVLVLLIILVLVLVGGLPLWPHGGLGYGYWPSGVVGLIVIVLVILLIAGRL